MDKNFKTELVVNNEPIELNPFTEQFLSQTVLGGVSTLRGADDIQKLELYLEPGDVRVIVNGDALPITPFPRDIITSTIVGMVSSLKGVDKAERVTIKIDV